MAVVKVSEVKNAGNLRIYLVAQPSGIALGFALWRGFRLVPDLAAAFKSPQIGRDLVLASFRALQLAWVRLHRGEQALPLDAAASYAVDMADGDIQRLQFQLQADDSD